MIRYRDFFLLKKFNLNLTGISLIEIKHIKH